MNLPGIRVLAPAGVCLALVLALALPTACEVEKNAPATSTAGEGARLPDGRIFRRSDLLRSIGTCVHARAQDFQTKADALDVAARGDRASARDAFRAAMASWQRLEVVQVGPAAPAASPGGKDFRSYIYAWPLAGRCLVEQGMVAKTYEGADFTTAVITTRGLTALEYVLFHDGTDNACAPTASINASGSWAAIAPADLETRKLEYARATAKDLAVRAHALADAWDPAKGGFVGSLAEAGKRPPFQTDHMGLNAVFDALLYIGFETRDLKVAKPAGVSGCTQTTCPEQLESQFAKVSKANVRENIEGFLQIFRGCSDKDLGFDDMLVAIGDAGLATRIVAAAERARAAVDAIEEPDLDTALTTDLPSVRHLYDELKALNDLLRTELVTVLDFELPRRLEGDND